MNKELLREINEMKSLILRMEKKLSWYESEMLKIKLNENEPIVFDLESIGYENIKKQYRDYSFNIQREGYDNFILKNGFGQYIFEKVNDLLSPDDVIKQLKSNYAMNDWQFQKREVEHGIAVYILFANINYNAEMFINDMDRLGYFKGSENEIEYGGLKLKQIKFEPKTQDDKTDEVKEMFDVMYHLSPTYNEASILQNGLIPKSENSFYSYPERVYLMNGDVMEHNIIAIGNNLSMLNKNEKNNGDYTLFEIDIKNLPDNIRMYFDPNAITGVFTDSPIPRDFIKIKNRYHFGNKTQKSEA